MKTPLNLLITELTLLTLVSAFSLQPLALLAQGGLTPPGAPVPTMKSLDQIEPRTPISSAPFTISAPGSYYVTTNLTVSSGSAITIATNGVTLDLKGFTISSTAASATGYGILLNSGLRNLTILNGFIQGGVTNDGSGNYTGSGFQYGINYSGTAPANAVVSKVSVAGVSYYGIRLGTGNATVVEDCTATTVGVYGIWASTIKDSVVTDCGNNAIYSDQVANCRGISNSGGIGVYATASAQNCYGSGSGNDGIYVPGTAQNCYGYNYGGGGAGVDTRTAQNCYGYSNSSGTGLTSIIAIGCYGYSSSGIGLTATIANSCIIGHGTTNITYKYNMP